jgi:predicted type IV restriction endonuclease
VAVYQDKAKERIRKGLPKYRKLVDKARSLNMNEADTRRIVTGVLEELLGWHAFEDISGEYRIRGNYVDFVISHEGRLVAVIEVKAVGLKLTDQHLYQAVTYAANEGVDWVILTNGGEWRLYRVIFGKPVEKDLVFCVSLADDSTTPKEKADLLYLLSHEADKKNELAAFYQKKVALCGANVAKAILAEDVLRRLRAEVRAKTGHLVPLDELAQILVQDVFRPDVQNAEMARLLKKVSSLSRSTGRKTSSEAAAVAPTCLGEKQA